MEKPGSGNIFSKIRSVYFQLTRKEQVIADYVLLHRDRVQHMSISELAEACGVADATVSRFIGHLNCGGYQAFRMAAAQMNQPQPKSAGNDLDNNFLFTILEQHIQTLRTTAESLDMVTLQKVAQVLHKANRVFCIGEGTSATIAEFTSNLFSTISPKFQFITNPWRQVVSAILMDPSDVIILFSYSGSNLQSTREFLPTVKGQNATVILVTRFPKCPAASYADITISCDLSDANRKLPTVISHCSQLFIIDMLFNSYFAVDKDANLKNQQKVENALRIIHSK